MAKKKTTKRAKSRAKPSKAIARQPAEPDPVEVEAAIEQCVRWIVTGQRDADIVTAIADEYPQLDAKDIVTEALGKIASAALADPAYLRGFVLTGYHEIYRQALESADLAVALRALKLIDDFARR